MTDSEAVRSLILRYFESWQEPADYDLLRSCLADDVVFDSGASTLAGADELREMIESTGSPWESVTLLKSMFCADGGALFYEGVDKATQVKIRVGEHLAVKDGKIEGITAVICNLGPAKI